MSQLIGWALALSSIGIFAWSYFDAHSASPETDFVFDKFDRGLYEAGKLAFINIHFHYDGAHPIKVKSFYKVGIFSGLTEANATPEKMGYMEDGLWKGFIAEIDGKSATEMTLLPKSKTWMTSWGPQLTADQAKVLSTSGSGAGMIFMGAIRWTARYKDYEVDYCGITQDNPQVYVLCQNHNGPADIDVTR